MNAAGSDIPNVSNGLQLVANHEYMLAIKEFRKVIDLLPPTSARARSGLHSNIGYCYMALGMYREALSSFRRCDQADPIVLERMIACNVRLASGPSAVLDLLTKLCGISGIPDSRVEKVAESLTPTIDLDRIISLLTPSYPTVAKRIGTERMIRRLVLTPSLPMHAITDYLSTRSSNSNPTLSGFIDLAAIHPSSAEDHARSALELNPYSDAALVNIGNALFASGQAGEAVASYHKATRLEPENIPAQFNLALSLEKAGGVKLREALEVYCGIADKFPLARYRAGCIHRFLGDDAKATESYILYLSSGAFKNDPSVLSMVAGLMRGTDPIGAEEYIEELKFVDPSFLY